jgi:hypothetical protein
MAKKLAPLVIPAVIDTSGIDRGVNNIRSKLSRVRGQGGGAGGGGGGGYGGGVNPTAFLGGGSAVGTAMGAAFGAAFANRRSFEGMKERDVRRNMTNVYNQSNIISRTLDRISSFAFERRNQYNQQAKQFLQNLYQKSPHLIGSPDAKMNPEYQRLMAKGEWWGAGWGYDKNGFGRSRNVPFGQSFPGIGMMAKRAATRFGQVYSNASSLTQGLSVGAAGVMGLGAIDFMSGRSMESRFSDITRFEGSKDYESIRRLKASSYQSPEQGRGQAFFVGAQNAAGGRRPMIQQFGEQLNQGQQSFFQGLGSATEQAFTIGFQAVYQLVEAGMSSRVNLGAFGNQLRRAIN